MISRSLGLRHCQPGIDLHPEGFHHEKAYKGNVFNPQTIQT
jgi:hypothetical protein